jgi:5'-methylthioadenosine phosphorylase
VPALLLRRHGEGHVLNPSQVPYRANLFALKQLGATHVIASGAVGSLREEWQPRDLLLPDSTIDRTRDRAATFFEQAAVHVEFADPFCPVLRQLLTDAGEEADATVHAKGTYVCIEGPQFSTRAESHMHRLWGGDVVGMTLLPEARLAREAELPYAAVCLVTDYDCWRPRDGTTPHDPHALLNEIIGHLKAATTNAMSLIRRAVATMPDRSSQLSTCPAKEALSLGIWSDKSRIDPSEVERLKPLWGRHF